MAKRIIQIEEKVPLKMLLPLSVQHLFAMFGATVLVPFLFGINPAIVLLMNGIGTLLFIFITKGKAPAYLGSSFAFLAPANIVIAQFGYPYALGGFIAVGFLGCVLSFVIKKFGVKWIDVVLPPAAMGPVVALIGLELSGSAASTAGLLEPVIDPKNAIVFLITLSVAVIGSVCFRKFLGHHPDLGRRCGWIYQRRLLRYGRFYSCARSSTFRASKLHDAPIQYQRDLDDLASHPRDHVRTHWTPSRDEPNRRTRSDQGSWTRPHFVWRQLLDNDLRILRLCPNDDLWRKHRCHGSYGRL